MQNSLSSRHIDIFCKLRRNVFSNFNKSDIIDQNRIQINTLNDNASYSSEYTIQNLEDYNENHNENGGKYKNIFDITKENNIHYNLVKEINLYGVNLNVDIFILKNSNIIFFLQNIINIYNPLIKSLRTIFTKNDYNITCSSLYKEFLIIVLHNSLKYSCIQIYCIEKQILKEEVILNDCDYYEKIYIQKDSKYFLLITNKNILKVFDSEKKIFIFSIYLHLEYSNILQYHDFFIILRERKLYIWNLEKTYTGLKLKENNLELEENIFVNCFCIYDRNILIVTTNGSIFLWKNLTEKKEIKNENNGECFHKDIINYIYYYENHITTKGNESLKIWKCNFNISRISESNVLTIKLLNEIKISININNIISHDKFFLIIDKKNCTVYASKKNNYDDIAIFYNDHNSKIKNIFCSDKNIFSFGLNGKIYDYKKDDNGIERNVCLYKFKNCITCLKYLYTENDFFFFCLGFNNGLIKIIKIKHLYLDILYCLKTSNNQIIKIEKNEESEFICVISEKEPYVFFLFKYFNEFKPLGYLKISECLIKNCFYFSVSNSFYILGDNNYLFKIDVESLREQQKKKVQEMDKNELGKRKDDTVKNKEINRNEETKKEKKRKEIEEMDKIGNEKIEENNNVYDLNIKYEIIKIQFKENNKKKYKSDDYFVIFNNYDNNNNEENEYENISENEYKLDTSSSDLSDDSYNKMNFYRDKIALTKNINDVDFEKKKIIFENKKKNLKKYIEILFDENVLKQLEKVKKEYLHSLSINLERGERREEISDNFKNRVKNEINISSVVKIKNKGLFLSTCGIKNDCLFFLNLNKKGVKKNGITTISPIIVYKINNKYFQAKTYIQKMIINENNYLLFCLTNNNEIYIFSTKFLFLYYYIKIPFYEKVKDFFVNKNNNKQYIFICVNNKYIKLNFTFSFFHLFNIIKRYHLNISKCLHSLKDENMITYDSLFNFFVEEIHDYIIDQFIKKKKKKNIIIPFTFKDIEDDLNFIIQLFHLEEMKKKENKKKENDIMDIWNFIRKNEKEDQKEEIEENKKKIDLILNYDQKNINIFFNLNSDIKDHDIQYSLRETKEAKKNEDKIRKASLYKKNVNIKIKKLKRKYQKLNRKKKFIIDTNLSYYLYLNLKKKIQEIKNFFTYNQQIYDRKIEYLSKKFIRLNFSKNLLYTSDKNVTTKCIKTYLKYNKCKEYRKSKKEKIGKKKENKSFDITTEINEYIQNFEKLRERNKNLKTLNDEQKIEEISQKKKILKMYEDIISKLDNINEEEKMNQSPKKISHITEIIRNYEENKKKLLNQINFIKEAFNEDFNSLRSRITVKLIQLRDEISFLKDMLKNKNKINNEEKDYSCKNYEEHNNDEEKESKKDEDIYDKNDEKEIKYEEEIGKEKMDKIKKYEIFLQNTKNFLLLNEKDTKIYKISSISFDQKFFENKYKNYNKKYIESLIEKMIKKFDREIHLLNMKRIQAIRIVKYISLKIISIDEKNNILTELRKKEIKLRKQKKKYIKEMKNIENEINKYIDDIKVLLEELENHNKSRDQIFDKLKQIMGDNSLCYDILIKSLKKNHDDASDDSEGSDKSDDLDGNNSIIDIYNKEEIDSIKKENIIILKSINSIKKSIENKKNDQRKLIIKKKNIEKEVELINEEISIIEDDKKKNISEVKSYITLKISKLRNIDYLYDKKKYRLNLASNCTILSLEQYKDIMKKIENCLKQKEKFLFKYKSLKKKNKELENINNNLLKKANDKKKNLKKKLKKNDIKFDFDDLEKKFQEKKKKGVLEEIKNKENEHNQRINVMNKELKKKIRLLNEVRKKNTLLLEKINEYIQMLKRIKSEENYR
ncbi:conserved Plasmodium protein, unknown function [Plasmodium relictum]|uniref:Uncharacterized protein n=1 Tax=Plasmodium relictum TaxID=85471 RepID=A0A1J1HCU8_PLARL|nr:conserved Plasmodium protein, unknown function [Plasmodium relictum]CRH01244.1 conserved Plasmodium protein, unknown function [Plasmodium relictum]